MYSRDNILPIARLAISFNKSQYDIYPSYELEKYTLVVPNLLRRKSALFLSILQMPLLSVWAVAIILFAIFRKIIRSVQKSKFYDFGEIFFNTFALSFGTAGQSANTTLISGSEHLLIWFLSLFAMLASILCSGIFFKEFTTISLIPSINSLEDLGRYPQIEVLMPSNFHNSMETWMKHR